MIGGHSRTARRIAGGGTGAPENALNDAANDWASSLGALRGRRTASHAGRRQKLPGESPSMAAVSREASQMGNVGLIVLTIPKNSVKVWCDRVPQGTCRVLK